MARWRTLLIATLLPATAVVDHAAQAEVLIGLATPLTGVNAWTGASTLRGAELAVADLNGAGGVQGEQVEMLTVDDHCSAEQAPLAARKLVEAGVVAVFGHECSGAAIPASSIYADAGVLMISSAATNPKLTEQGFSNVFRVIGRDDVQGRIAADLLAERFADAPIAILHDGEAYGEGLALETRKRLNEHGVSEVMFEAIAPDAADYSDVVQKMRALGVQAVYYGGYPQGPGLIVRQAHAAGYDLQLVAGDGLASEDFWLIAGPAGEGALMTLPPPPPPTPENADLVDKLGPHGGCTACAFSVYAALEAWSQAVEEAGTFKPEAVANALRTGRFETVLGTLGFDAKGDVSGPDTFVWYVWKGGTYVPLDDPPQVK